MNLKERYFHFYQITYRGKCSIGRYIEIIRGINIVVDFRITCMLTQDHSEDVSFAFTFK